MERKVLLKDLVSTGTHIRTEFMPKAVISDKGKQPVAEFWDANKTIDVIVNNSHAQHDNIRELDEYAHAEESRARAEEQRLDRVKVGRITVDNVKTLTNAQINSLSAGDVVIKDENGSKHIYAVAYKQDDEMSLVYADCWTVEEVYYEKSGDDWSYIQTDVFKPEHYYTKSQTDQLLLQKQGTLVSGTNIKTIAGQSILGEGNLNIQQVVLANEQMPADWDTSHTMHDLIESINADEDAVPGKIYLSTVNISDLPTGMSQAEVKVEIMGVQSGKKILLFSITSADISPYRWEYTAYNMSEGPWRSWLPSNTTIPTVPTNVSAFNNDAGYLTSHQDLSSIISRLEAIE